MAAEGLGYALTTIDSRLDLTASGAVESEIEKDDKWILELTDAAPSFAHRATSAGGLSATAVTVGKSAQRQVSC